MPFLITAMGMGITPHASSCGECGRFSVVTCLPFRSKSMSVMIRDDPLIMSSLFSSHHLPAALRMVGFGPLMHHRASTTRRHYPGIWVGERYLLIGCFE